MKIKSYNDFCNEEINLRKTIAGAALGASLLGGMSSCKKTPADMGESPMYIKFHSGAFDLVSYSDNCSGTPDSEITGQLSTYPSFSSTQYYKIGKGKYSYEYVLDQMSDGRWKYSGTFEVFNYTDSDKHWDFYLFSGDNAGSMYGGRMPDVPKNVEVGYKETLPEQVIELSGGKIIITTNREKIN